MRVQPDLRNPTSRSAVARSGAGGGLARLVCLLALGLLGLAPLAQAQDDLPSRVGRLADVGGQVFVSPEDRTSDWTPIGINYTVTTGDNLWAGNDARAEVDFGAGRFRLAADTNVHISRLDDTTIALFVAQGRLILRLRFLEPGDVARIDTPNTQVVVTRPGLYRVEVAPDRQSTTLIVREGEANLQLANTVQQVLPGQTAYAGGSDPAYAEVRSGIGTDGFDVYSANRERRYDRNRSANHVSRQMVGAADLDEYGNWQTYPEYGAVWFPTAVAADWAPYRYGSWASVGGWGWTWVDAAPWGYAPFHYGRWAYIGGRWGWCPGGYVARPYWAPAMVGWVGGGGWTVSVNVGAPVYGWVPLGWGEPYVPWWRGCGSRCWTQYNRPYAVNVAERPNAPPTRYINWTAPGGVTAVAGANLVAHKPVAVNRINVPASNIAQIPVIAGPTLAKPALAQIQGVRAGAAGTPAPASTFYPATKPRLTAPVSAPVGAGTPATSVGPAPVAKPAVAAPGAPVSAVPAPAAAKPAVTAPGFAGAPASAAPGAAVGKPAVTAAPASVVPPGRGDAPASAAPRGFAQKPGSGAPSSDAPIATPAPRQPAPAMSAAPASSPPQRAGAPVVNAPAYQPPPAPASSQFATPARQQPAASEQPSRPQPATSAPPPPRAQPAMNAPPASAQRAALPPAVTPAPRVAPAPVPMQGPAAAAQPPPPKPPPQNAEQRGGKQPKPSEKDK